MVTGIIDLCEAQSPEMAQQLRSAIPGPGSELGETPLNKVCTLADFFQISCLECAGGAHPTFPSTRAAGSAELDGDSVGGPDSGGAVGGEGEEGEQR